MAEQAAPKPMRIRREDVKVSAKRNHRLPSYNGKWYAEAYTVPKPKIGKLNNMIVCASGDTEKEARELVAAALRRMERENKIALY
jgi:hypothetical protein